MDGFSIGVGRIVYNDPRNPLDGGNRFDGSLEEGSGSLGVWAGNGLGVRGSDYDAKVWEGRAGGTDENSLTRPREIGFDNTGDNNSSEAVIIDLQNAAVAMTLSLKHFYKGVDWENDESGMIVFYRLLNGEYVQVHSEVFHADNNGGNYSASSGCFTLSHARDAQHPGHVFVSPLSAKGRQRVQGAPAGNG